MGGRIDCYVDIASLYSYLAFVHLTKNLELLEAHGVEVEFHPILLGAIMAKTSNNPPWALPARAAYLTQYESPRATAHFGHPEIRAPADLMAVAHTVLPNRCLHHLKQTQPRATYHAALRALFRAFWTPPNADLSTQREVLVAVLRDGVKGELAPEVVVEAVEAAGRREAKEALTRATGEALARGAFGAPWLWVTDGEGREEPFFGSDRFHYVYNFLGLPYRDVELLPPANKPKL